LAEKIPEVGRTEDFFHFMLTFAEMFCCWIQVMGSGHDSKCLIFFMICQRYESNEIPDHQNDFNSIRPFFLN
jgi:hypothetical protein